ncbi:hypothetical protein [Saccharopolyspora shandongensis]|uniref:hypothetical protein n=1 Tax=Saccharopolyspora shandongensis TaxID=418495 RepID=UPI0034097FAE
MQSQNTALTSTGPQPGAREYERLAVIATFPKRDLANELPEDLAPHVHATQNS